MSDTSLGGGLLIALVLLGLFVAVLWVFLPFAVFGLKDLVRRAVEEQQRTNETLGRLEARLAERERRS